jgi:RNA polymerase sigma-70 factor (ECF subfamily)
MADGASGPGRPPAAEPADPHPAASPLRALEACEMRRRLALCLEKLPAAWRAILALRDGGDRPYEEIAAALGLALGTVRSRLARARLALRDCVEGTS